MKRTAFGAVARDAVQSVPATTLPKAGSNTTSPLVECPVERQKPKLIILSFSYLASRLRTGHPVIETLQRLKGMDEDEVVMPKNVFDELDNACRCKRKSADGSLIITEKQMTELRNAILTSAISITAESHEAFVRSMGEIYDCILAGGQAAESQENATEKEKDNAIPASALKGFSTAQVIRIFCREFGYNYEGRTKEHHVRNPATGMSGSIPEAREVDNLTLDSILKDNGISRRAFLEAALKAGAAARNKVRHVVRDANSDSSMDLAQ